MKKKCPQCSLINFASAVKCQRCRAELVEIKTVEAPAPKKTFLTSRLFRRAAVCAFAVAVALAGFYLSLIVSAKPLVYDERKTVERAVLVLETKGFSHDVLLLRYFTAFRREDNWLNASVPKENAYAATNFPVEIMTLYPDFFAYPADDTERAAILLHEAQHLKGADEKEAYAFVWKNRKQLGWTKEKYGNSVIWGNVRRQTREVAPELFVCEMNNFSDCTE